MTTFQAKRDKIIRLELDKYVVLYYKMSKEDREYWKDEYSCLTERKDITPIFGKNGMYWNRTKGLAWIECNGNAKEWSVKEVKYELCMLNCGEKYNQNLIDTLKNLLFIHKIKDRKLLKLYWDLNQWLECRKVFRNTKKFMITTLREFRENLK